MKQMAAKLTSTPTALQTALASFELHIFREQTHDWMKGKSEEKLEDSLEMCKVIRKQQADKKKRQVK